MAIVVDTHSLDYQPISYLLITTLLSSLALLVALEIKECVSQFITLFIPADLPKRFIFTLMITLFFLFLMVLMSWSFQDKIN